MPGVASVDPIACAYAAGLFDGEGSVMILHQSEPRGPAGWYHQLRATVGMYDGSAVEWLREQFGGSIYTMRRPAGSPRSDLWSWTVKSRAAEDFLRQIRPYLRTKANQAYVSLRFRETFPVAPGKTRDDIRDEREVLRTELRRLNARGQHRLPAAAPVVPGSRMNH